MFAEFPRGLVATFAFLGSSASVAILHFDPRYHYRQNEMDESGQWDLTKIIPFRLRSVVNDTG